MQRFTLNLYFILGFGFVLFEDPHSMSDVLNHGEIHDIGGKKVTENFIFFFYLILKLKKF